MDCLFCKIAEGKISATKVFENDALIAFNDINPKAKVHILLVPKKHIESVKELQDADKELMGELVLVAKEIAAENNLAGYKLVINVGREGGQVINHLHMHLLSGNILGV